MTIEGAVILIWSVTLLLALAITVAAVAMLVRIGKAARGTDRLLKETLPAAAGIATNTGAVRELEAVGAAARPPAGGTPPPPPGPGGGCPHTRALPTVA